MRSVITRNRAVIHRRIRDEMLDSALIFQAFLGTRGTGQDRLV